MGEFLKFLINFFETYCKKLYKVITVLYVLAAIVIVVGIIGLWLLPPVNCFIHASVCLLVCLILTIVGSLLEKKLTNLLKKVESCE